MQRDEKQKSLLASADANEGAAIIHETTTNESHLPHRSEVTWWYGVTQGGIGGLPLDTTMGMIKHAYMLKQYEDMCGCGCQSPIYKIGTITWQYFTHDYAAYKGQCILFLEVSAESQGLLFSTWWRHQMETFSALLAICA